MRQRDARPALRRAPFVRRTTPRPASTDPLGLDTLISTLPLWFNHTAPSPKKQEIPVLGTENFSPALAYLFGQYAQFRQGIISVEHVEGLQQGVCGEVLGQIQPFQQYFPATGGVRHT